MGRKKIIYRHTLFFFTLCFIALHRYCVFYKLKVWGSPVSSKSVVAIFPMASAHFMSLCHILVVLALFIFIFFNKFIFIFGGVGSSLLHTRFL